jgi:hypothetical protein
MKDPRMEQWRQRLKMMQSYHTTDEVIRAFGAPGQRVPERDREIWHFPLGVVEGLLYSIHAVTCKGALNEAYMHAMPAGTHVQQGTREQIEQIRHRSWVLRVVWIAFIGSVLAGLLIPHGLGLHPSRATVRLFGVGYFLCGGLALGIFSIVYWRCPVCKNEFSRQSGGKYCEHCNTKFND